MTRAISALGDSAVLLPASALFLLYLAALREGRLALGWLATLAVGGGATVLAKLAFHACGEAITDLDVVSPSGHASFATLFWGALAATVASGRPRSVRLGLAAAAAAVALLVGASRVRMGAHSVEEVVLGLGIGAASLGVFLAAHRRAGRPPVSALPLAAGLALVLVLLGGQHFSLERRIAATARSWAAAFDVCAPPARTARRL